MKIALSLFGIGLVLGAQGLPGYLARYFPKLEGSQHSRFRQGYGCTEAPVYCRELLIVSVCLIYYIVRHPRECLKHLNSCE